MPALIDKYLLTTDLYRLNVKLSSQLSIQNEAIPVDLISLSYSKALPSYQYGAFTLERAHSADKAYHLRYNILSGGQTLGFILTDRTKKFGINQHIRPLHIENKAHYTLGFAQLLPEFLQTFGLEVANHSQLDISLDNQQVDLAKLIHYYTSKPALYQRIKRKNDPGIIFRGKKDEVTGVVSGTTYFGESKSKVSLKIYDKTAELASKPKDYLSDWYTANGFDMSKPVYRLELSIKSEALKSYRPFAVTNDGEEISLYKAASYNNALTKASRQTEVTSYEIEIERLNSPAYLASLFEHFFNIDIRKKDATRATNCTRVDLINFRIYEREQVNKMVCIKATGNKMIMEKKMIKQHLIDYKTTGEEIYLTVARATAARHKLLDTLAELMVKLCPGTPVAQDTEDPIEDWPLQRAA